jgi:sporulation protein YlmC with PRC-barrel domain
MKTLLSLGAIVAVLGLAGASTLAQTQSTATSSNTTYVQTSKLVGTKVKSSQGEEIGTVKDVVLDRNTGCMAYTVLATGGGGARVTGGGKLVSVPWAVYSPTSDLSVLTVTVDRDRIYNAPVFDYARIDEYSRPDYITNVYSYYGVSQGAAAGAGVSTTTTTGAAARAGATGSPAATGSPGPMRSPPATASPAGTASPSPHATTTVSPRASAPTRPHATASPSQEGAETASPPARGARGARGRPEASPAGGAETASPSERQGGPSEGGSPGERARTSRHHGKPTGTPSEKPQEQE